MANQKTSNQGNVAGKYHLEISQSVQDMENSIPLIRGKRAYARAYFDHDNSKLAEGVYRARLKLNKPSRQFESLNSITLDPGNPVSIDRQRLHWDLSFNFDFDPDWDKVKVKNKISTGFLELVLDSDVAPIKFEADDRSKEFTIVDSPCLKVTCLLLRYWNAETEDYVMPDPVQVDAIRDFVVSAFPVAENSVEWNTISVQATNEFRSLDKLTKPRPSLEEVTSMAMRELLLQTTVHRNMDTFTNDDWSNTHDIRTIYLAVFDDPSGRLGGASTDSPTFPVHNIAGASVVDLSGQIGAHELAHILGREHPGVPLRNIYGPYLGQRQEDGDLGKEYMGFLNAESKTTQGLHINPQFKTPRIYESNMYFDLMTYRDPQWLSDYSYRGIKKRLDDLYMDQYKNYYITKPNTLVVIGEYDLNRQTGRILFVLPTSYKGFDLQLKDSKNQAKPKDPKNKKQLAVYQDLEDQLDISLICIENKEKKSDPDIEHENNVYHSFHYTGDTSGKKPRDMPNFGIFQATIEKINLLRIELKVAGNIVDVYEGISYDQEGAYSSRLKKIASSLNKITKDQQSRPQIEHPLRYMNKNRNQSLLFYYDVIEDEYYLRFNWLAKSRESENDNSGKFKKGKLKRKNPEEILDSKILSTIQCKRPGCDEWVTVMVSSRRKGKAWISSDLVEMKLDEYEKDLDFSDKPFYSHLSKKPRSLRSISEDLIEIRVLFSAGFARGILPAVEKTAKIFFPNEFLQNQQDRGVNRNYLEVKNDPSLEDLRNRSGKHRPMY